jgi:hypothetical protein
MLIDDIHTTDNTLKQFNSMLREEFDLSLSVDDINEAKRIFKLYEDKNKHLSYINPSISIEDKVYRKNTLIMESMRIILREVAPKRSKSKRGKYETQ